MNFKELPNGMVDGFVLLKKVEVKKTRTGSEYLDMVLADKDGEISAKLWDNRGEGSVLEAEMIVKVRGTIEQYNGKQQFRVAQIRPVNAEDSYNLSDLVPASEVGGEQLFLMIKKCVNTFENEELKSLVSKIIDDRREKFVKYPAAVRLHHAMVGGLVYHTMSILRMAEELCRIYPNINRELLLSGVILHDIAKTCEYETSKSGLAKSYSVEGELIGHLVKGAMIIDETARELGITGEIVTLLEHMLISHHGVPEFGVAVRPMFLEAQILSTLDTLDATIFEINNALSNVEVGKFSDRQWALDNRKLYNHGMSSTKHTVNFGE